MSANLVLATLALCTGFLAGAAFAAVGAPIPAPPTAAGVLGIVGIYLGFKVVDHLGVGYDLLSAFGL